MIEQLTPADGPRSSSTSRSTSTATAAGCSSDAANTRRTPRACWPAWAARSTCRPAP
ncbi:hypothetical protein ACFQZ4_18885 [Catellatospora coxensis]